MYTVLESIGTANPPTKVSQADAARFMSQVGRMSPSVRNRIPAIYARSGIDYRYSCLADYEQQDAQQFQFYPPDWSLQPAPTTAARNEYYQQAALNIAEQAAQQAIAQSTLQATEITHLIAVSCTGFFSPGLDVHLIQRLGLPPTTARTMIGFMGCNAAFNGLRVAHSICQSQEARVLLVCVELCTLHFQIENSIESVITNVLFGDGAAAALLTSRSQQQAQGQLAYSDGCSLVLENTRDLMSWTIGDTGFSMKLSPDVPKVIASHLPNYLTPFLRRHHLEQESLNFWAIHPGGRQIVDQIQASLGLGNDLVRDSYEVLRQYGNMSSATILFILRRLLERHQTGLGYQNGIALGFGTGLSIEGCLFQQVAEA